MIIYKITNTITNKCYVGQTQRTMNKRFQEHIRHSKHGVITCLYNAMRKYGVENFEIVEIDRATTADELNQKEIYWISKLNTMSPNGYNEMAGGDNNPMNSEFVQNKHKNKMQSADVRQKISQTMKQFRKEHPFSVEHRERLARSALGNKNSQGKKRTVEAIQKTSQSLYKQITLIGNGVVIEFECVRDLAIWCIEHKLWDSKTVHKVSTRIKEYSDKNKSRNGYKFIYK